MSSSSGPRGTRSPSPGGAGRGRARLRRGTPTAHDLAGMEHALRLARAAAVRDEVPVGCVLMHGSTVLGEAHNETAQRHDPMAHAEVLALQRAIQAGLAELLPVATLYITLEPCAQCAGAIVLARVGRVVFGAWDQRAGMAEIGRASCRERG